MIQNVVFILLFVLVVVFAASLVANWLAGASGAWKALAERYPSQPTAEFGEERTANIFLSQTDDPRGVLKPRGCLLVGHSWFAGNRNAQNVRAVIDDYYLHLDLDSGAGGPKQPMSIPWGAVQIGEVIQAHPGPHAVLTVDEYTLLVPTASIERELLMRRAMEEQLDEDPFDQEDGYAT